MNEIKYKTANLKDIPQIQKLLNKYQLPYEDVITSKVLFIIALANGQIIGCIGMEKKENNGLLRSFVVEERFQKQGVGNELFKISLDEARKEKTKVMHLLTTTAETYFCKKGFVKTNRNEAPKDIKETAEFSKLCPSSSVYMNLDLHNINNY
ncbi:MAG: arsenic resistance N-acetyltransferase ArsN2 [Chitinophagaceae bacterium]|nr:arsenic resistance N-acetyltransferase ArsN2 [Chitinophagaceae bacterium]